MKTKSFIARRAFIGRLRPFISRAAAFIARRATCLLALLLFAAPALAQGQDVHLLVCAGKGYTIQSPQGKDAAGSALTFTWYEKDHSSSGDYNQIATTTVSSYTVDAKKVGGTYSYVRKAANAECQGVPSNTYTIVVLAPAVPAITAPQNVCQDAGDLVFTATGDAGSTFTWTTVSGTDGTANDNDNSSSYTVSGASTGTTSVTASASVTYNIDGFDDKVCVSGTATAQSAVVYSLPKVAQVGAATWCGSGSHTLEVTAEVSGSSEGVSVAWYTDAGLNNESTVSNSTSHTVPAATGPDGVQTYTYYVQATANACTGAAATVTGVRNLYEGELDGYTPPTHAASDSIWTFGSSTLVWSDRIAIPECNKADFTSSSSESYCRSYNDGGTLWYYYNWPYVNTNAATLCPAPWRVPTQEDFAALVKSTNKETLIAKWGYGGFASSSELKNVDKIGNYWSTDTYDTANAYYLGYVSSSQYVDYTNTYYGYQVRCVK